MKLTFIMPYLNLKIALMTWRLVRNTNFGTTDLLNQKLCQWGPAFCVLTSASQSPERLVKIQIA